MIVHSWKYLLYTAPLFAGLRRYCPSVAEPLHVMTNGQLPLMRPMFIVNTIVEPERWAVPESGHTGHPQGSPR